MNQNTAGYGCLGILVLAFLVALGMDAGLVLVILVFAALVGIYIAFTSGARPSESPAERPPQASASRTAPSGARQQPSFTIQVTYGGAETDPSSSLPHVDPDQVWTPPGRTVEVAGYTLEGGMLYIGRRLGSADGWRPEPALIDPKLAVDRNHPDREGANLTYWPSYGELPPASRAAFLEWLASGREDPETPIGYVFLYFYGLERRVLADRQVSAKARREVPAILLEVERLLSLYGEHTSFAGYASSFLQYVRLASSEDTAPPLPEPFPEPTEHLFQRRAYELPTEVRLRLGQLLAAGLPLPAPWALAWYVTAPMSNLRTPAVRCARLFRRQFVQRYHERFGEGLKVRPNKSRLTVRYGAASGGIRREHSIRLDLPDVTRLEAPLRKIGEVVDAATDDLDAYSRWLGRNEGDGRSLDAVALLPAGLLTEVGSQELVELKTWLENTVDHQERALVETDELLRHWPTNKVDRMARKEAAAASQLLESLGYGMEPDVRFGGPALKPGGKLVLFRRPQDSPTAPSKEYAAAALLLHLSAVVAAADGEIAAAEERHLEEHLESGLHLSDGERTRLGAHRDWLMAEPPGFAGLKKRLTSLQREQRRGLAGFVVSVAGADGRIDAQEVKILSRIYGLLGLEPDAVYGDLHSLTSSSGPATRPVTVREGRPAPPGFKLPPEPSASSGAASDGGLDLDMERVRTLRRESEETRRLLAEIFLEPDEVEAVATSSATVESDEAPVAGLDPVHSALLRALAVSPTWSRHDFDALADRLGILPGGAFENLNEAAFETCDVPLIEGEDPLEIDHEVLQEMLS